MQDPTASVRKADHIELAFKSQTEANDERFIYEPLFAPHPRHGSLSPVSLADKVMRAPIWISSMTGGTEKAGFINKNLAIACKTFGLGMGLGSCRMLLHSDQYLQDFQLRKFMGDQPLFANLGIAQLEQLLLDQQMHKVQELIKKLEADGLIIHVNLLQEWVQPEGDVFLHPPLETIKRTLDALAVPIMVKEVGQGFGPKSLKALLQLPLEAVDYGAFGGTNFSLLEAARNGDSRAEIAQVGHTAVQMTEWVSALVEMESEKINAKAIIVSGGIKNYLDGFWHLRKLPMKALYAQASAFLKHALQGEEAVLKYTEEQIRGLELAHACLEVK